MSNKIIRKVHMQGTMEYTSLSVYKGSMLIETLVRKKFTEVGYYQIKFLDEYGYTVAWFDNCGTLQAFGRKLRDDKPGVMDGDSWYTINTKVNFFNGKTVTPQRMNEYAAMHISTLQDIWDYYDDSATG